jgi:hypothetical protein
VVAVFQSRKSCDFGKTESSLDHRDDLTAMLSSLLLNPQDPKSWNWPRLETEVLAAARRVVSARSVERDVDEYGLQRTLFPIL